MQNTPCPPSSDGPLLRRKCVLGKELLIKDYICSSDGIHYPKKPEKIKTQLSICPTDFCAASCAFCIAKNIRSTARIDLKKLENALRRLKEEDIVRGVSITGGEPFTDVKLLNETILLVFEVLGQGTEIALNTNGFALHRMHELQALEKLDALHISRHHDDDVVNNRMFGMNMPGRDELKRILHSVSYRDLFVLNCLLMKGGIATPEDAHRFMDFAIDVGAGKVSFITPIPINACVAAQRVDYTQVLKEDDPSLLFTRGYIDYDVCRCQDGVYASGDGRIIEFYGRCTTPSDCSYCRGFVYGADNHLRVGFGGEIIL